MRPAYPAYTPPEHVTAVSSALERARAAGIDYRTRFGRLPTRREVMDAVGVSESTATRALRPLKAEPDTRQVVNAAADESTARHARPQPGTDRTGVEHDTARPAAQRRGCRPSPRPRCAPARRRPRTRGGHVAAPGHRSQHSAPRTGHGSIRDVGRAAGCRTPTWAEQRPLTPTRQPGPTPGTATTPATTEQTRPGHRRTAAADTSTD